MKFNATSIAVRSRARYHLKKLLLAMKLTTLLLIIALVQASAAGFSQVRLAEKNASLEKVLTAIENQTGYTFFYDLKDIRDVKVTLKVDNVSLSQALDKCFNSLSLTYEIKDKTVFVLKKEPTVLEKVKEAFAAFDVHGRIVGDDGQPLSGATIQAKGGNNATSTDANAISPFTMWTPTPSSLPVLSATKKQNSKPRPN